MFGKIEILMSFGPNDDKIGGGGFKDQISWSLVKWDT